jgi:hypothetical protein
VRDFCEPVKGGGFEGAVDEEGVVVWAGLLAGSGETGWDGITANECERDNSDSLEETVVDGQQRQRERAPVLWRHPEALAHDREDNDDHACEGEGTCFRQLSQSVSNEIVCTAAE